MIQNKRAVVLWTGGKDCNLALYEAQRLGYQIVRLVTFSIGDGNLRAHPFEIMQSQALSLNLPYEVIPIKEPFESSYETAILYLKQTYDIDTIVTGDISEVHGNTNWITERSKPSGIKVLLPLWHLERENILNKLISLKFKVIFSCVKFPWFTMDWLGKEINVEIIDKLKELQFSNGLDICGENGEYHSMVLNGPGYCHEIEMTSFEKQNDNGTMFINWCDPKQ